MPRLWSALRSRRDQSPESTESRYSVNDYASFFTFDGIQYPIVSQSGGGMGLSDKEKPDNSFLGYIRQAYKADGVVYACMLARSSVFSEARFVWQRMVDGRPGEYYTTNRLGILNRPWPNGSTGDLLMRMIQDVDLAGNFYAVREERRLRRLRPDWVEIILTAPPAEAVASDVAGYLYRPGGPSSKTLPRTFTPDEIVHWAPEPDPESQYRGMSWLTPVLREVEADRKATAHKLAFFDKGATLQTAVTFSDQVTKQQFQDFVAAFKQAHQGVRNAYEPLFLGAGADVTPIGTDLRQLDFKATQGAGETRIAAASGIHPVIVGLSEGLAGSSLNQGNFNAARRLTADKCYRPLWRKAIGVLEKLVQVPRDSRLWYDDRDIPFLREDRADLADIQGREAQSIRTLLDAGYDGATVVAAIDNQDWSLLRHTGLFSVQLQPPATANPEEENTPVDAELVEDEDDEDEPDAVAT